MTQPSPRALDASTPLEAVLKQIPSGVALVEAPTGRLVLHNDQFLEIWRVEDATAASIAEYTRFRGFHPDGRPYAAEDWPLARSLRRGETINNEEIEIERFDGTRGVIIASTAPIRDPEARIVAAVAILEDVTERRAEERRRAYLMEAGRVLALSLDYQETLAALARLAVPTLADWCAVDVIEEGAVQRLALVHSDPTKEPLAREIARRWSADPEAPTGVPQVLRTGEPELHSEITNEMLREGTDDPEHYRLLSQVGIRSAMIVPMMARGEALGAITFVAADSGRRFGREDLDFARQLAALAANAVDNALLYRQAQIAREQAEQARADAESANRAKTEFLSNMSHEIRTPINAIIGYTELLDLGIGGTLTDAQRKQIDRVRLSSEHLLSLVDTVLDLAKVEAGRLDVSQQKALLVSAVAPALALVTPQATARDVRIQEPSAEEAAIVYVGDERRVRQILVNLLTNAIKFTPAGGRVGIACGTAPRRQAAAGRDEEAMAFVRVEDTGVGISPEESELVFEPFEQAARSRRMEGTGLGLTISRQLARLMGGDVTLESRVGQGSTFTLWLPTREVVTPLLQEATDLAGTTADPGGGSADVAGALRAAVPEILQAFVRQMRVEVESARELSTADLEDHTYALLADIAGSLIAIDAPASHDLIRDGGEIQNVICRLHGAQRARLGWNPEAISLEYDILRTTVDRAVRSRAPVCPDTDYAIGLLARALRHAERQSLQSLRRTTAATALRGK